MALGGGGAGMGGFAHLEAVPQDKEPMTAKDLLNCYVTPPLKYAPRDKVNGCVMTYYHCAAGQCGGYFATMRGLRNHFEFVHRGR